MVHSDLKNTIDLIKNINGLQLNFNNQNLSFKQYSRNSKNITFTNQLGMDVNVSLEELNNQYKKKYTITNESSVDTSIFNSKNKGLIGGNEDISATSVSYMSKINNNNISNSLTSDSSLKNNSLKTNSILVGGNEEISQTSDSYMSKINNNISNSLTSDSSLKKNNSFKINSILVGGNEEISQTSDSYMSKINNNINNSLTSDSSIKSNTSKTSGFLIGGNNNELSITSIEEASAFESESLSILKSEEILKGGGEEVNNTFVTINLEEYRNNLKSDISKSDTVNYQSSSTLNSLTELKDMSSQVSDTAAINKFLGQNGGGNSFFMKNNTKSYNINSSSTSSVCE